MLLLMGAAMMSMESDDVGSSVGDENKNMVK